MTKNKSDISIAIEIIRKCRDLFWSLLFPLRCPVCDEILEPEFLLSPNHSKSAFVPQIPGIHPECAVKLHPVETPFCLHCGRPLGFAADEKESQNAKRGYEISSTREFCYECMRVYGIANPWSECNKPLNSNITSGRALYLYQGEIKKIMYRFKYSNKREYAQFFADRAIEKYAGWIHKNQIDVIVPVPMYKKKQKLRGYNQAESFAKALSERTGIKIDTNLVKRVKDTVPQKNLSNLERKNNLKKAFQKGKSIVQYSHVLVVDDIYTTGATAEAVAQEIKNIGACQVYMLSICIGRDM